MVSISYSPVFEKRVRKLKDAALKEKVKKQLIKIINNPEIGKPMKYSRAGTRELYVSPFRLSYSYLKKEEKIVILDLYHKDGQ